MKYYIKKMTTIRLTTVINAPVEMVFDLSRDIDFHTISVKHSKEKAISGTITGRIGLNETVTWRAKHFGVYLTHQSLITAFEYPKKFTDQMIKGKFKSFIHHHFFNPSDQGTEMTDIISYETPYGVLGRLVNLLILRRYLTNLMKLRNEAIKSYLENLNQKP